MKTNKAGGGLGGSASPRSQAKVLASLVVVGFIVAAVVVVVVEQIPLL